MYILFWNCDETGFCLAVASQKVKVKRGASSVHETTGGSARSYITVLGCASASGCALPPFMVYKGIYIKKKWLAHGLAGALYGVSESGWMEGCNFLSWFKKQFVPAVRHLLKTGPVVLFVDRHHSHITLELIQFAQDKGVHLIMLSTKLHPHSATFGRRYLCSCEIRMEKHPLGVQAADTSCQC